MEVEMEPVHVIGAGLAGSEATWQLIKYGIPVILHEMRPKASDPAHKTGNFAELVCSNSLRAAGCRKCRRSAQRRNAPFRQSHYGTGR
jgi:tRNA:m(5)U-54 methyltransferase